MKITLFQMLMPICPTLEAMLNDLDGRGADAVYCLGDLAGYNVWPNEVSAQIRERRIATLAGNPDACYVLLTLGEKSAAADTNSIRVAFIRVPYDVEQAATAIEKSPLPDEFADRLRKAY